MSLQDEILKYVKKQYGTDPDYPWRSYPDYIVLRQEDNQKWYGLLIAVHRETVGLDGSGFVDLLNVKLDPMMVDLLRSQGGYLPAYHMNRKYWLSVRLDGSVSFENICNLLDQSFSLTESSAHQSRSKTASPRDWLIPANPRYYDVIAAFKEREILHWTQSSHVHVGDLVYMYVAAPYSAILFKCRALEVDIYQQEGSQRKRLMKIQLLHTYDPAFMPLERLRREFGVYGVRGPRSIPNSLKYELDLYVGI